MLHYDSIDISKGTDLAKSNNSKECMICHYFVLIMESNFNTLCAMVVMNCQCSGLI